MMNFTPRAIAADAPADQSTGAASKSNEVLLEEVTVTGTRIKRKDLEALSPLVTIDSEQIESRAGLNLESFLNQLPEYNPAQTPTTTNFDVQPSAVNTVGISTISLRGFGANRSLVLIDGHRTTPINALMVTDINSIPASMIDHIEIITGGASAVYGADAIGGVTNFILKKNFEGAQLDIQDGVTQAGDGNELLASGLIGSKIGDGRGNIIAGVEYYNRDGAYQRNRSFFTNAWTDPNAPQTAANALFVQGYSGYNTGIAASPSAAAMTTLFPGRGAGQFGYPAVFGYSATPPPFGYGGISTLFFNADQSMFTQSGPLGTSNYTGPTSTNGYGVAYALDPTQQNSSLAATAPNVVQTLKWNNPLAYVSSPQTRYSFFANADYDITDKIQFYINSRFAQSLTQTLLPTPTTAIFGWEANVPFNAATDSPINPAVISNATTQANLQLIYNAFKAGTQATTTVGGLPVVNPAYVPIGTAGAQHPVPWQLAMALLSRGAVNGIPPFAGGGTLLGGPVTCSNALSPAECSSAPTSWMLWYLPQNGAPQRSTVDTSQTFQIETGFHFPVVADWTGELYYSRGQSLNYENGYGSDSLQRFRSVIDAPGYGQNQNFQGNFNSDSTNFGTSVPTHCTSGFYNSIFAADGAVSPDCLNAVTSTLQTYTAMQQDIVELNFQGTLFKLPAGDVSGALGYQYRRDSGQFTPDNLQATNSFLDQTLGLYPLGTLIQPEIQAKDVYAEMFIPVVQDLPFLKKLNLDIGGRYSDYSNTPNATTFKVNFDAQLTNALRVRGGFNRATRAPNLGELYLGEQEYFGGGAAFGDPCSLESLAPFGAKGAAPDLTSTGKFDGSYTPPLASGQTLAGATSTYLICQAMMGGTLPTANTAPNAVAAIPGTGGAGQFYGAAQGSAGAVFAWLNEGGNPNLRSETADTWSAGLVFSQLSDNAWLSGLNGSIDWWQVHIQNAIELDSPDFANYLCFGTNIVSTPGAAAAQAASAACQNVGRSMVNGGALTSLLTYTNAATIGTAGVDVQINWLVQLSDVGLKIPGAFSFNSQDTFLSYYRSKTSPASFDVNTDWKDSFGPTLAGTNGGAYGYRLNTSFAYVLPSFNINLRWRFLPSVNSAAHATQAAIIENNKTVSAGGSGTLLSYIPNTDIAAPSWSAVDLSASWNINKVLQVRGGINNLFDVAPAITGASKGYAPGTNLNAVCPTSGAPGCVNPTTYSLPSDGAGFTNAGFYDVYGRTFWIGMRARF